MRSKLQIIAGLCILLTSFAEAQAQPLRLNTVTIPLAGNAWGNVYDDGSRAIVDTAGIRNWPDSYATYKVWFRLSHPGKLSIGLVGNSRRDSSTTIELSLNNITRKVKLRNAQPTAYSVGTWLIEDTGYHYVLIRRGNGPANAPVNIQSLLLSGPAATPPIAYVPNNEGNFFYWGRRGPSVHLNYETDKTPNTEYFYNELTVPAHEDRVGSYFMADGFSVGYFGMQVNSPTERRILFSVWSPFTTDDPRAIPDSLKIVLIRKGEGVHAGTFGDEGAGGQSYLIYPWSAGNTYRFLLRAEPLTDNHTRFTAWFFAPEQNQWQLIACWDRPATHSWLTHLHSFLENFEPEQGDNDRLCYYGNQWTRDSAGHWTPLTRARFTGDNTARRGYRLDYAGGTKDTTFFLRNGGFFDQPTPLDTWFSRPAPHAISPSVDPANLP